MGRKPYKKRNTKKNEQWKENEPCCPRSKETHNSPDWYTREFVPQIGANFSTLSTIAPLMRVFPSGVRMNTCVIHDTMLSPPIDPSGSALLKVAELYAEIREMNSGAANYTPNHLAAYMFNVTAMRAMVAYVTRALAAIRMGSSLMKESPSLYYYAVTGHDQTANYAVEASNYSINFNALAMLMKDIEYLPIVPIAYLDRNEFIYGTLFTDSQTSRPATIAFVPATYGMWSVDANTGNLIVNMKAMGTGVSIAQWIQEIRTLYQLIVNDNLNVIIRGDLMKAFGVDAIRPTLLPTLQTPLRMGYNEDVACQLENATLASGSGTVNASLTSATLSLSNSHVGSQYELPANIVNYHGEVAPTGGALLSVTRLATQGTKTDTGTTVTVSASSGITITETRFLANCDMGSATYVKLGTLLNDAYSSTQSTAVAALTHIASYAGLVDRFPMVIIDEDDPDGKIFDVDNFTIIDKQTMIDYTELANRSLFDIHLPRTTTGRVDRDGLIR